MYREILKKNNDENHDAQRPEHFIEYYFKCFF
jgi:hypothetical protein